MLIRTDKPSRRQVLRGVLNGAAVAVSLPLLNAFLDGNGTAMAETGKPLPMRFGTWFWGLGVDNNVFVPKTTGTGYDLPKQLEALAGVRQHVNLFTNFNIFNDGRPNLCHYSGWVALRCGSTPSTRQSKPGQSLDCAISDRIGSGSRFSTLNLAATGRPRDSLSFRDADSMNPADISAVELYQKVFGADFVNPNSASFTPDPKVMVRKSVLSSITEQSKALEQTLGAADRARLDQYYTSVRELENRLAMQLEKPPAAPNCKVPGKAPADMPIGLDVERVAARHKAMVDLLVMALSCNQTKVFNVLYSDSGSSLDPQWPGEDPPRLYPRGSDGHRAWLPAERLLVRRARDGILGLSDQGHGRNARRRWLAARSLAALCPLRLQSGQDPFDCRYPDVHRRQAERPGQDRSAHRWQGRGRVPAGLHGAAPV